MAKKENSGRKANQRLKPYLVLQYLLKHTDEENVVNAENIVAYLTETCGIEAERRAIYKDIEEINKVLYILENGCDIYEAEEAVEYEGNRAVVYDKSRRGFYVQQRQFDYTDIRLLAECIYSSKFLNDGQTKRLIKAISALVSKAQAKEINYEAVVTDRVKTNSKSVLNNITALNNAMHKSKGHTPEKVSFKYLKCSINNLNQNAERRNGERYIVSPYKLLINDGYYYLLAFDERSQDMRTYRVDRMEDVRLMGEKREGAEAYEAIDIESYSQRTFSMFGGKTENVTIRFRNQLLDTVVDKFGKKSAIYQRADEEHFTVTTKINVSPSFFAWVCTFGKRARIVSPAPVVNDFKKYLDNIRSAYE